MSKIFFIALLLLAESSLAQDETFIKTITCGDSAKPIRTRMVCQLADPQMDPGPYLAAAGWTKNPRTGDQQLIRSLLYVDLRSLPANAIIRKASLYLYANNKNYIGNIGNPMYGNRNELVFEKVSDKWDPENVFWSGQPEGKKQGAKKLVKTRGTVQNDTVDITDFVQSWVNKPDENNGMVMKLDQEPSYSMLRIFHAAATDAIEKYSGRNNPNQKQDLQRMRTKGSAAFDPLSFSALSNSRIYYNEKAPDSLQPKLVISYRIKPELNIRLYPVPASGFLTLTIRSDKNGKAVYEIIDATGRLVSAQAVTLGKGTNTFSVKGISSLANGLYSLRVLIDKNQAVKKFSVIK
jgi:hypothetical protein